MPAATSVAQTKEQIWAAIDQEEQSGAATHIEHQAPTAATTAPQVVASNPAAADPYGDLPAPVREELLGLKTMLGQVSNRLRNAEGHIGGLNSQLQQAQRAAQQPAMPTPQQIDAVARGDGSWDELEKDYPDFTRPLRKAMNAELSAIRKEIGTNTTQGLLTPEQANVMVENKLESFRREFAVETRHPGWKDQVATPQFRGWLEMQPREVQVLANSDDPRDAIRLLDLRNGAAPQTQQQTNNPSPIDLVANLPTGRRGATARGKPVEEMSKAEYWAYLDALEKSNKG